MVQHGAVVRVHDGFPREGPVREAADGNARDVRGPGREKLHVPRGGAGTAVDGPGDVGDECAEATFALFEGASGFHQVGHVETRDAEARVVSVRVVVGAAFCHHVPDDAVMACHGERHGAGAASTGPGAGEVSRRVAPRGGDGIEPAVAAGCFVRMSSEVTPACVHPDAGPLRVGKP